MPLLKNKLQSFSHQEYNKDQYNNPESILKAMESGTDLFGRTAEELQTVEVEDNDYLPMQYEMLMPNPMDDDVSPAGGGGRGVRGIRLAGRRECGSPKDEQGWGGFPVQNPPSCTNTKANRYLHPKKHAIFFSPYLCIVIELYHP